MKLSRLKFGFASSALVLAFSLLSLSAPASAGVAVGISVGVAPPALPVYEQPACPGPGYLWTPGYWGWNEDGGYYWVPGTWVVAPAGMLWTPGYWGFEHGRYGWHGGYWGPHVGFYGGVNYGFGYGGVGFVGGEWRGGAFFYNRAVLNVNVGMVHNVYSRNVIVNNVHVSFNGPGGVLVRPTVEEERWSHEPHRMALAEQRHHEREASHNREFFASANHGHPGMAATARPGEFHGAHMEHASARGEERGNHGFEHADRRVEDRHVNDRHVNDRHVDEHRGNDRHVDQHRGNDRHEPTKHGRDR
jgi:hypothetical protein